ncbi:MAG: 2OG-Fe(II) oxygenase [Candidatus Symbiodolus clandestinus]
MNKIVKGEGYLIFDDFLSNNELFALQLYMQFENYCLVHSHGWSKSWRMIDGEPLVSISYRYSCLTGKTTVDNSIITAGIDILSQKINTIILHLRDFLKEQWNAFSLTTFLYPAGSGLGWHEDDAEYKGAYIFYAHPEWKPSWGGELFLIDTPVNSSAGLSENTYNASEEVLRMSGITGGAVGPEFGWTIRERNINDSGVGVFIYPKPNRLVVIKPNYSHCIKKVEANAGDNLRCSVAGFFQET